MDVLVALDILLGLSLVYLVFSLAVTSLNEFIAAWLSSRAKWLRKGIGSLLSTDPKSLNLKEADKVLDSPFVTYLGTKGISKTFRASYIPAWPMMQGILSTVETVKDDAFATVDGIRTLAEKLPATSPIRSVLVDLCARANGDLEKFREMLETWFKTFEEQVTGWYRQKTQYVLIALSMVVVVAMNVDTIDIIRQLSADPVVRKAVAEKAMVTARSATINEYFDVKPRDQAKEALESAVKEREKLELCSKKHSNNPDCTTEAITKARDDESARLKTLTTEQNKLDQQIKGSMEALSDSGLRLGWDKAGWRFENIINVLQKIVGLLLSAFAVSLGAPFWFDVLKSVASVRSVGANMRERKAAESQ